MSVTKEEIKELYCKTVSGRYVKVGQTSFIRTLAYKIGIAKITSTRDIKNEFNKLVNANSLTVEDVRDITNFRIEAPGFFIDELEKYALYEYFKGDEKFFQTKNEYFSSYEETYEKYSGLVKVLKTKEVIITELNKTFEEIDVDKQINATSNIKNQYNKVLNDIKDDLSKKVLSLRDQDKDPVKDNLKLVVAPAANKLSVLAQKNVYDFILKDFIMFKQGQKYFLQHKEYHKGKDPTDYRGSFTVDTSKPSSDKFQFHNNAEFIKKYNYKQTKVALHTAKKLFINQIIDLDAKTTVVPVTIAV